MHMLKQWFLKIWWRFIRFGFRLLYNEMAWTYDIVAWTVSMGQWRNWQRTALKHLPPPSANILEVAHGTGNLQLDLHQAGYQRTALDLSRAMGVIARRKLRRNNVDACLVRAEAQHLPFSDGHFNAIVSTFPTPFVFEAATLQAFHRVLTDDGKVIIVLNGLLTSKNIASQTLELAYRITGQRGDPTIALNDLFTPYGFTATIVDEPCPRSIAQLIIASKTVENHPPSTLH